MTSADLIDQLDVLGLSLADLAELTGQSEIWCSRLVTGDEAIPTWLDLLLAYWSQMSETLEIARAYVDAGQAGVN